MGEVIQCVLHGSFRKHFTEMRYVYEVFSNAGIKVIAPKMSELVAEEDGFAFFEDELGQDPRLIELLYLQQLKHLGPNGFSYFVNPGGYIGKTASYELAIAQLTNTHCYFMEALSDHPAYLPPRSIWQPDALAAFIIRTGQLPQLGHRRDEQKIRELWEDLMVPGSVVATGAIIEHQPKYHTKQKEILLVKTHKWGNRFSIVGGKVRRNETLNQALIREVHEETNLKGLVGQHLCTFDQLKNSGYYQRGVQHIFVDNIVQVTNKRVVLNEEAQDYIWALPNEALNHLDIEPNARQTVELYAALATASS